MENGPAPVVSVVMPTFNQAHLLRDAVQSVLDQDFPRWELLVINNYSDDNTLEVLEGFPDARIRCENFRNEGIIAASRNRGIRLARGEFVAFLDSDDTWYPSKLSKCLATAAGGFHAVCHGMLVRQDGTPAGALLPSLGDRDLYRALLFGGNPVITTSAVMVRKECLDRAGGFCEDREIATSEDYDLWLRLAREGARFLLLPEVLGEYRVHRRSASQNIWRQSEAEAAVVAREFARIPDDSPSVPVRKRLRMALVHLQASRRFQRAGMYRDAALALARAALMLLR